MLTPINKPADWVEATKNQQRKNGQNFDQWKNDSLKEVKLALFDGKSKEGKAWEAYILQALCQRYMLDQAPKSQGKKKESSVREHDSLPNINT